jgi:hypothetical protein
MSSFLVNRYADLSKRPLSEVEACWRTAKRQANESGKKSHWPTILALFKQSLNLNEADGRLVYFHDVPAEIVAETPGYALIRVLEPSKVEESMRTMVTQSQGLMTVNYEHLFNRPNSAPIGYPHERLSEDTSSCMVGDATPMASRYSAFVPGLMVKHKKKKRKAVVNYATPKKVGIQYVDENNRYVGESEEVDPSELSVQRSSLYEEAEALWESMSPTLTEDQRKTGLREILRMEHRLDQIPEPLVEAVVNSFSSRTNRIQHLQLDDNDWNIILSKDEESSPEAADDKSPLPVKPSTASKPAPQPQDKQPSTSPRATPRASRPSSDLREPSEQEIRGLIGAVGESVKPLKPVNGDLKERLQQRGAQWDAMFGS